MSKKILQVPADEDLLKKLDEIRDEKPRARVMREAFYAYYFFLKEKALDQLYLEGYKRTPEDTVFPEAQAELLGKTFSGEDW